MKIKFSRLIAAAASAAMVVSAAAPVASAYDGRRTIPENFDGTDTSYKARFMSLYTDVLTNGQANGYLSSNSTVSGGFGIPYHSVEEVCVEAPDYGHLTTSEAMSYLVWIAAMRDYIVENDSTYGTTGDLTKAWETMEYMVPGWKDTSTATTKSVQTGFWGGTPSAQYSSDEPATPDLYPSGTDANNTGEDPIYSYFQTAYKSDVGVYLLHWLADVDDWYGYSGRFNSGKDLGSFTFINTFQRGEQESCFETIPHPSVETLEYGITGRGIIAAFNCESNPAKQWRYTNAPDAEGRAIQGVYFASRYGVSGYSSLASDAGKMTDYLRGDMFDKYYKPIGCQNKSAKRSGTYDSCHYLMGWYTSWGGALDGMWRWKIACSHVHYFYQNPLQAYAALVDTGINSGMKASNATTDWATSLTRQLELFQWLQSAEGPFAGGCSNSYNNYSTYPAGSTTFYDMVYVEHPVYADPGSNHWIGNQVWATQRLTELYYYTIQDAGQNAYADKANEQLASVLPSWVQWFVDETLWDDAAEAEVGIEGANYAIPGGINWTGAPATWTGTKPASSAVHAAEITYYTASDIGCVASLANTLLWYAAATDLTADTSDDALGDDAFDVAKKLIDRAWALNRDDIGVSGIETNGSYSRMFTQVVYVPTSYNGKMPNGDPIVNGATFSSIRTEYEKVERYQEMKAVFDETGSTESYEYYLHRFWHAGDMLMALGTMALLFPDEVPESEDAGLLGDVNNDGKVNAMDATLAARYAVGSYSLDAAAIKRGDVNGDGKVNAMDATLIARYAVGSLAKFPIQ